MEHQLSFNDAKPDSVDRFTFEPLTAGTTVSGVPYVKTHATCVLENGQAHRRVALTFGQDNIDLLKQAIVDGGAMLSYQLRFLSALVITGGAPSAQAA